MHLVGREAELAVVRSCLDARTGHARVLVVRGEAGIGKTMLLSALVEAAENSRYDVRLGRATELESDSPLALFRGVLDLGHTPDDDRWRRVQAMRAVLDDTRPAALVLDDVHWADAASLELVELLLRRPPRSRHLIALGVRPGAVADRLISAIRSTGSALDLLDLPGLDRNAADALLGTSRPAHERDRLYAVSGGNPLFLHELGRAAGTALPDGLIAAVTAELAPLTSDALALARTGSLLGDPFDFDIARVAASLGLDRALAALDELADHRLVRGGASLKEFRFRHPVVRTAIYQSQTPTERLTGHTRAAAALADAGRPLTERARHLALTVAAGDTGTAAQLREAASRIRTQAPTIAADWLIAAYGADPMIGVPVVSELAELLVQSGRLDEALAVAEDSLDAGAGSTHDRARLALVAGSVERQLGRHEAARRRLQQALGHHVLVDELTVALALSAYELGDYAEVADRAASVRDADHPVVRAAAAALQAMMLRFSGAIEESRAAAAAAVAVLRDTASADLGLNPELVTATVWPLIAIERLEDALAISRRAAAAARTTGNPVGEVPILLAEVSALGLLGRTTEAAGVADRAELTARMTRLDQPLQWALWMRAWVLLDQGDLDEALRCAQESVSLAEVLDKSALVVVARAVLGSVLLAVGRAAEAVPLLAEYDVEPGWVCRWAPRLVEAQLAVGDRTGALESAARATRIAQDSGLAGPLAAAAIARALTSTGIQSLPDAEEAIARATEIDARLDLARGHLLAGRARATSDRTGAIEDLQSAREIARTCGAARLEDEASLELRRLGRRIGRGGSRSAGSTGGSDVTSLSAREREIAELVARGHTNRQIAALLFLSEKTIEAHLSRTFTKLGVSARAAVAAAIAAGADRTP